jgi:S-adenosylmethionine:tRNA ribosyltransferase-isomerase
VNWLLIVGGKTGYDVNNFKICGNLSMKMTSEILIKDFDYNLPDEKIAAHPLKERDESKLLVFQNQKIRTDNFKNLPAHLPSDATLILNNTRVIEARILFQKKTGGVIEIFCLEPSDNLSHSVALSNHQRVKWNCLIGGASKWKHGDILEKEITIEGNKAILYAKYIEKKQDVFIIEFSWNAPFSFAEVLHTAGLIPLPPYIKRTPIKEDSERYQTIFAKNEGSVAAPTAALHFTDKVFEDLNTKNISTSYVTLHVGVGTFKPVKTETIAEHSMHAEQFEVTINTLKHLTRNENIIAVGTTSLRTLESLYWIGVKITNGLIRETEELKLEQWEAYELENKTLSYKESLEAIIKFLEEKKLETLFCQTSLIIIPGYQFFSAKALITNFHQPKSTLLLLVAAFIGNDWKTVYDYALKNEFRFLSYGDSNLLWRKD